MRSFRLATVAALLCIVSACGGPDTNAPDAAAPSAADTPPSAAPANPPGPSVAEGEDEVAVETAFTDYNEALLGGDAPAACALSAPTTVETLLMAVSQQLGQEVGSCEEAFELIFSAPGTAELTEQTAATTDIQDITVDGDAATVTWSAQVQGQPQSVTNELIRIDDRWVIGTA